MEKDSQDALQSEEIPNYVASPIDGLLFATKSSFVILK